MNLRLPVVKRPRRGPARTPACLSQLAEQHALPAKIIEYRQYAKLKNTYVDALPKLVHPLTRRVHTSFKQDVAATGRLSSTEPNLQNIPVRTREGREIRAAFVPGSRAGGCCVPTIRRSNCGCWPISRRTRRCCRLCRGSDIHAQVASEVHAVPLDQVTPTCARRPRRSTSA